MTAEGSPTIANDGWVLGKASLLVEPVDGDPLVLPSVGSADLDGPVVTLQQQEAWYLRPGSNTATFGATGPGMGTLDEFYRSADRIFVTLDGWMS